MVLNNFKQMRLRLVNYLAEENVHFSKNIRNEDEVNRVEKSQHDIQIDNYYYFLWNIAVSIIIYLSVHIVLMCPLPRYGQYF